MRVAVVICLAALVCGAVPAAASAHARLLYSTPANGEVLQSPPREVVLRFDDPVALGPGNAAVDRAGHSVLDGRAHARGRKLTIPLEPIARGSYTVRWSVVSDDGHTVGGVVAFAVGFGSIPHPTLSAGGGDPPAIDVAARWLLLAGALLAAGATAFLLAVVRRPRVVVLAAVGFALTGAGAAIEWSRVPAGTRFGHAMIAALVAAVCGVVVATGALRVRIVSWQRVSWLRVSWLLVAPALAILVAPVYGGHALDAGVPRVQVAVDVLHLASASAWLGGLAALALVLPVDGAAARRFSRIALGAVLTLAITGVLRAISELRSTGQLLSTGYGRALVVKTVIFAVLVLLGYRARTRLLLRARALRAQAAVELVLLGALVVAVAVLTSLAPGITHAVHAAAAAAPGPPPTPPPGAVTAARQLRGLGVAIAVEPAGSRLRVTATVIGPNGDGADGLAVAIAGASTSHCGAGCYLGEAPRARSVRVSVGAQTLTFPVPSFPLHDGTTLLRRISARYLQTHAFVFRERLASGPGQVVTSNWRLQAPASLSFRASDGSAGVIIGGRRWDKQGNGRWVASPQSPHVPQPALPWPASPANVVQLPSIRAAGRKLVRVSFLDASTPAWFTVTAEARTNAVRRIDMVAPAHFMRDVYVTPRRPLEIRPPS